MKNIVLSFCEKNYINLELSPISSSSTFSLKTITKDKDKDKETNQSSNSKNQPYIRKSSTVKIDFDELNQNQFHNSVGFRKKDKKKLSIKNNDAMNNSLINSNKKNDINKNYNANNISTANNTKLLYEKMKKKTYSNYFRKNMNANQNNNNYNDYLKKTDKKNNRFGSVGKRRSNLDYNKFNNFANKKKSSKYNNFSKYNEKYNDKGKDKNGERRHSLTNSHRPILSLDDIAASFNLMKENRNKIIKKFKKDKVSAKIQSLYILATSPVLRLSEQIIFSHSSPKIQKVLSIKTILKNHNIFLNAKANELKNEIELCDKRIETPFIASKIADITLNFITSMDEEEFKNFDILEANNKDDIEDYYNFIKILFILFNESYDERINGKRLKTILLEKVKGKGFDFLKDYLYYIYIDKKEETNVLTKIDLINNILRKSPNLLDFHESLKNRFMAFTNYLIKEIISYANNVNDVFELKYRANNLLDIVLDKIDKIKKNVKLEK